jgi:hypothetical protein
MKMLRNNTWLYDERTSYVQLTLLVKLGFLYSIYKKVTVVLVDAMKAHRAAAVVRLHSFLTLATDVTKETPLRPDRYTPQSPREKNPRTPWMVG